MKPYLLSDDAIRRLAVYVIESERSQWLIRHGGMKFYGYNSSAEAIAAAIDTAKRAGELGFKARVALLAGSDNLKIVWTFGVDAYPPPLGSFGWAGGALADSLTSDGVSYKEHLIAEHRGKINRIRRSQRKMKARETTGS